ncbi:MAG TPA: hypothetical protein VFS54_07215 [Solirubrobacterales bacterium]|nr:hypothetical protein [Solirubrobacterales bacterium]
MGLHRLLMTALAISVTALLVPASSPASNAGGVLSMAAARKATRSVAWEVARRNLSVNSVKLGACQRRSTERIVCEATDRGSTSTLKTTCAVRVDVTLAGNRPKGTLRGVNCDNQPFLVLRALQALEATRPVAEELGPKNVGIDIVGRVSRSEIKTMAAWIRPSISNPTAKEACALNFHVSLEPSGEVAVQLTESESFCVAL